MWEFCAYINATPIPSLPYPLSILRRMIGPIFSWFTLVCPERVFKVCSEWSEPMLFKLWDILNMVPVIWYYFFLKKYICNILQFSRLLSLIIKRRNLGSSDGAWKSFAFVLICLLSDETERLLVANTIVAPLRIPLAHAWVCQQLQWTAPCPLEASHFKHQYLSTSSEGFLQCWGIFTAQ